MIPCTCCYNCTKRELGCHSKCEDYISYKNKNDELREKYRDFSVLTNYSKVNAKRNAKRTIGTPNPSSKRKGVM